jgi:hypothetical protein
VKIVNQKSYQQKVRDNMFEFRDNIIEKLINKDLENLTETEIKAIEIALTMEELYERVLDERLGLSETDNFKLRYKV